MKLGMDRADHVGQARTTEKTIASTHRKMGALVEEIGKRVGAMSKLLSRLPTLLVAPRRPL